MSYKESQNAVNSSSIINSKLEFSFHISLIAIVAPPKVNETAL